MGVKSNYFRHSFDAHNDAKIRKLIQRCGAKAYAIYFVLLEVYCSKLKDDDGHDVEQEIDLKLVGSYLGLRSDSVHSCMIVMEELKLIEALSLKYDQTMIKLSIPKLLKYYGKYKNVSDENCPNKRKEKERKEKENKIYYKGGKELGVIPVQSKSEFFEPIALQTASPESTATSTSVEIARVKNNSTPAGDESKLARLRTWEFYENAYLSRYGVNPVRNAKINGQIRQFVERLGAVEAPLVARFYLSHNSAKYVSNAHPVGFMLLDAEKLRTEWLRGKQITATEAHSSENKQQIINAFNKFLKPEDL
jgi:hypothetical protein